MFPKTLPRARLLALYRDLLRGAKAFPSIKRASLIEDIRIEFREKSAETDPVKIAHAIEVGLRGLETLGKYSGFSRKSPTWSLHLDQDPLGAGEAEQRRAEKLAADLAVAKAAKAAKQAAAAGPAVANSPVAGGSAKAAGNATNDSAAVPGSGSGR